MATILYFQLMKTKRVILFLFVVLAAGCATGQKKAVTTILLTRHAEKASATDDNPPLSEAGKARALRLTTLFPNAKPDEFYSTPYKRTMETLQPWADKTGLQIQTYDASNLAEFANRLNDKKGKTIVVAGHSNTTPALANLLLGEDRYKTMADDEYNKIFIITVNKGLVQGKVLEY